MDTRLDGKHALVCGSTQGIGKAVAQVMARLGARVTLLARDEMKLRDTLGSLERFAGTRHGMVVADMADTDHLQTTLQEYLRAWAGANRGEQHGGAACWQCS
jgi:3-oxoacyl-[acyl-carrier protein] reductase